MGEFSDTFAPRGMRESTTYIVVHTTASGRSSTPEDVINYFYTPEANGGPKGGPWKSCGYHDLIAKDGTIVHALHPRAIGAHVGDVGKPVKLGLNRRAYGVSWVGGAASLDITDAQWASLGRRVAEMVERWPGAEVVGHRDLIAEFGGSAKACPWFDARIWWAQNRDRLLGHDGPASGPENAEPEIIEDVGDADDDTDAVPATLRRGMHGPDVRRLQKKLIEKGADIVADGAFGPATDKAVRKFQRDNGLGVDGIVGRMTWAKLG